MKISLLNNIRRTAGLIFEVMQLYSLFDFRDLIRLNFLAVVPLTYESTILLLSPVNTKLSFKLKHYNSLQCLAGHYPFDLIT